MNLLSTKELWAGLTSRKRDALAYESRPYRDWRNLVVGFFCLLVLLALYHGYWFVSHDIAEVGTSRGTTSAIKALNVTGLHETIARFDAKEQHFNELLQATSTMADPAK